MATDNLQAEFSQSRSDLHWRVWAGEDKFIRWAGYDDRNWWQNVATQESKRVRVGPSTGRVFTIDFDTGLVTVETARGAAA